MILFLFITKKLMNCTHHKNQISLICIAPHKCLYKRRLCPECLEEHGVDVKLTVPTNKFQAIVIQKLKEFKLNQTSELTE